MNQGGIIVHNHLLFFLLIVSLLMPSGAQANNQNSLPDIMINAPEIDVLATTHQVIIDKDTIENASAMTLNELLQENGIAVQQGSTPYENTTTSLRGFSTGLHDSEANAHLLFLINGKRSGVTNARQLTIANIERIEIIRGPQSYRYAASSPGGVINIITRRGTPESAGGELAFGYGSYRRSTAQLSTNGASHGFDYALSGQYNNIGADYKDGDGNKVEHSTTHDTRAAAANIGYTFANGQRIGGEFYYYNLGKGRRPYYYNEEDDIIEPPSVAYRDTWLLHMTYDGGSDDGRLNWKTSYGLSQDAYQSVKNPKAHTHNMGQKVKTRQLNASIDYTGDWVDLAFGSDFIDYITWNSGSPKPALGYPNGTPLHLGHTTKDYGIYLISTLKLLNNQLNITSGLRYDYWSARDKEIGDEPFMDPDRRKGAWYDDFLAQGWRPTIRQFEHLSPSIGISYLPLEGLKLRANYTQNFRAPSGRQLFSSDATEGYGSPGDPRLKAEITNSYEVGFDLALHPVNLSASYFYSDMRNHITIRGIQDPDEGIGASAQNAYKRKLEGIEFSINSNLAKLINQTQFDAIAYFSLTHMTASRELMKRNWDRRPHSYAGSWMPIGNLPKNLMSYGIRFHHPARKFSTALNFNYFGKAWGGQSPRFIAPGNYHRYGGFTIANLTAEQELWRFRNQNTLSARLNLNNLFNKTYAYKYNAPVATPYMQGRNYYLELDYRF
jgi:vitamin B12 transporter